MPKKIKWECEYCDDEFDTKKECLAHEKTHNKKSKQPKKEVVWECENCLQEFSSEENCLLHERKCGKKTIGFNFKFDFTKVLFVVAVLLLLFMYLPFPKYIEEKYTDTEPYVGTETYQEVVPYSVEECELDISLNPEDYIGRGIEALMSGDPNKLLEECKDVVKDRIETKERDVIRYKTVTKTRSVKIQVTLYELLKEEIQEYKEEKGRVDYLTIK